MTPEQLKKIEDELVRQENIQALKNLGRCTLVCQNLECPDDPTHRDCFFINKKFLRRDTPISH